LLLKNTQWHLGLGVFTRNLHVSYDDTVMNKLYNDPFQWMKCGPIAAVRSQLRTWYARYPGKWLQQQEQELLRQILPDLFGYHILQVNVYFDIDCMQASRIPYRIFLDNDMADSHTALPAGFDKNCVAISGLPESLPIASDSLDVLLYLHTLEFTSDPHEILREADRTLVPEGHVVILGFNPWGFWMLWRIILRWTKKPPWCGRFVRQTRLRDWLQLLGFDITATYSYFFRPPLSHPGIMNKLAFLEKLGLRWWPFFCGAYIIVAKKRVSGLTPLKPRWRPRRSRIVSPGLAGNSRATSQKHVKRKG